MSWDAYCALPSAKVVGLYGLDAKNLVWGKKGTFSPKAGELAKISTAGPGTLVSYDGTKMMIIKDSEGCLFAASSELCLVFKKLKKCAMVVIGDKSKKDKLIEECNKYTKPLIDGGY
mmetsp:Transcript_2151/g.2695  ORF Transcript_2151/g.2695 Transcript_2151/m.2695 type:complete len:117 (-) Transcript_2151:348-698(-)|eukprot:jgi/Bigna1/86788/estExt_fgenesh1_pg.C_130247